MASKRDLLSFLFVESTRDEASREDLSLAENLEKLFEEAAEIEKGELESKKTPLAKALASMGISDAEADLQLDTEGFVLATDNHDRYKDALIVLGTPDAMHKLAEMGWVVTKPGDDAMTNEAPNYRIRFFEITTVGEEDREPKPGYDDANREEVIKKAQEFAATPMDRDDDLNPVENGDGKVGKRDKGVGKAKDGDEAEKAIHGGQNESVNTYIVKVKHDKGTTKIRTTASSEDGAKEKVMAGEKCPARAILSVKMVESERKQRCAHCDQMKVSECQGYVDGWICADCRAPGGGKTGAETQAANEGLVQEFTSTGSMGTAMSQGQPFIGMVKKPKPYGKGTKFKTPGQWTVKQPVVKEQVKRKVHSESVESSAKAFLSEEGPDEPLSGEEGLSAEERQRRDDREGHAEGNLDAIERMENLPEENDRPELETEEDTEAYEEMRSDLQSGECIIFDDSRASGPTVVRYCGRELGRIGEGLEFESVEEALVAVKAEAEQNKFWPSIYHINDHGNVGLWDWDGNEIRGWV